VQVFTVLTGAAPLRRREEGGKMSARADSWGDTENNTTLNQSGVCRHGKLTFFAATDPSLA